MVGSAGVQGSSSPAELASFWADLWAGRYFCIGEEAGVRKMIYTPPPRHISTACGISGTVPQVEGCGGFQAGHRKPPEGHLRVMPSFCVAITSHYLRRHKVRSHSACRIAQVESG